MRSHTVAPAWHPVAVALVLDPESGAQVAHLGGFCPFLK